MLAELLTPSFVACAALTTIALGVVIGFKLGVSEGRRRALNRARIEAAADDVAAQKRTTLAKLVASRSA